jgi:Nuclear pore complex scaffold, nucleoporins 186/192/205
MANLSNIKRTWKACLTAPSDHKSFTFVRFTLMPALRNNTKKDERCDLHEFLLSVLTEFVSNYLDVVCASNAIPFSRSKWQENETERLLIAREEQERNRSFFQSYGGVYEEKHIPTEVDLLKRPDCIDDIAAVAIDLCSQGNEYAAKFWTAEDYRGENGSMQTRCAASRALKTLEMLQDKDPSLIPTYVSFLAALAIDQPSLVFDLLDKNEEIGGKIAMNWRTLFDTLRWYVRKMSDGYAGETKSSTTHESPSLTSNGYYYGVDDYSLTGNKGPTASASTVQPTNTRLEELREMNSAIVLSHLAVITKVASKYARGRTLLATMKLSIEGETSDQEGDSVLVVLFSLAIAPLSPNVRGAVFATLASLLKVEGTSAEEAKLIRDLARKGWDLLELSQVVPVMLLDQYQRKHPDGVSQTMTFPPSSLSLVSAGFQQGISPRFSVSLFSYRQAVECPRRGFPQIPSMGYCSKWNTLRVVLVAIPLRRVYCNSLLR